MLGAIAGDIVGSYYEHHPIKLRDFPLFHRRSRFTDDTVLTLAVARAALEDGDYLRAARELGKEFPDAGYGASFQRWLHSDEPEPYNSWGNGSAMRVSPVGFAFEGEQAVLREAQRSAEITHSHPEGVKGAQATALAIYLARIGEDKGVIRREISARFGYDLSRSLASTRPEYRFDVSCQGSVPQAIIAFLEAATYEDTVRNAVSLGGDSDTQACIAGGIAEAFFGPLDSALLAQVQAHLPEPLWEIVRRFCDRFLPQYNFG